MYMNPAVAIMHHAVEILEQSFVYGQGDLLVPFLTSAKPPLVSA